MSHRRQLVAEARRLGFEAVGFARADLPLADDFARYEAFVRDGKHGEMSWLAALPEARRSLDGEAILPGAKTVICLARRYGRRTDESEVADPAVARKIARYARGRDYHNGMRKKLRRLAALVRTFGARARPLCDEEPILERAWAARAGLGFVGKNGLLIVPGVGSLVLLGEVVTTLELEPDEPMAERCGACTRCLDVCPTSAFEAPYVLDPRRCVAYLTIEHRGPIAEPTVLRGIGDHLFGCDDCQTVCPFNATRLGGSRALELDPRFLPDPRWAGVSLVDVLSLDEAGFEALREGSPIARATRAGFARSAAIVLGHLLAANVDEDGSPLSQVSRAHVRRCLERAAVEHDVEIVRDAAAWALRR